jgi:long-chain fatty acid transport protein
MSRRVAPVVVLAAALLLPLQMEAQGGPTTLQFSFSNPGARSLGMGGAFAAVADDATAAFANPAGLTQLTRPEVSVEGRYWDYATPFTVSGRVSGEPTGIGLDTPLQTADSDFDTSSLSFLSFVYPGRNWTVALSRHQSAQFESYTATRGLFTDDRVDDPQPTCLPTGAVCRYPDITRQTDVSVVSTTASFAYRLSDGFSLGLGLSYFQGDLQMVQQTYVLIEETLPEGFFGPNAYERQALYGTGDYGWDGTDWGVNLGFLWFPTRQWSVGGFFRQGGELSGGGVELSGPALDPPYPEGSIGASEMGIPFEVPNVYGLGLAYRSRNGSWTGSLEWDRILYSEILDSIGSGDLIDTSSVRLDDANQLRLGVEYAFRQLDPLIALRGGVWRDPDHSIRSVEDDPLERALLPGGDDKTHLALGAGVVFKHFQVDLALDFSDPVNTAALSLIYQF